MRIIITSLFLISLTAGSAEAVTVQTTPLGTMLRKTDDIDYGTYGYRYAPTVIRDGTHEYCWFCAGVASRTNPDYATDHVALTEDWGAPQVVLCPATDDPRIPIEPCANQNTSGQDSVLVCDPSVINVGGIYYDFYTGAGSTGTDNQVFLATSTDRIHWVKYPSAAQPAQAVIPFWPPNFRYGSGEASAVYKDGQFWVWHTYAPWWSDNTVYLAKSWDGANFATAGRIFSEAVLPYGGQGGGGGVDVKYIPGWDLWFYVVATADKQGLTWNISRDGLHWLPWNSTYFGYQTRLISLPRRFAIAPALEGDGLGHIGDGSLASWKETRIIFTAGDGEDVGSFPTWTLDGADAFLFTQAATGVLESVDANLIATGWAYDKDAGSNDAAANGDPSHPLGFDTRVRGVAINTQNGTRYESGWFTAELARPELVTGGLAPDQYHGFAIDLNTMHLPPGTYTIQVEAGEFPTGMGATTISNTATVTIPGTVPTITLQTFYGQFVSAYACGGYSVTAAATTAGSCERFQVTDLNGGDLMDGDQIRLQAANGNFVSAEGGGCATQDCVLNANRSVGGAWETFTIHKSGGGAIHTWDAVNLQSSNGYYVCAEGGGGGVVNATRATPQQWETFVVQIQ